MGSAQDKYTAAGARSAKKGGPAIPASFRPSLFTASPEMLRAEQSSRSREMRLVRDRRDGPGSYLPSPCPPVRLAAARRLSAAVAAAAACGGDGGSCWQLLRWWWW